MTKERTRTDFPRHFSFCYGTHNISMAWCVPCGSVEHFNHHFGRVSSGYLVHRCTECLGEMQLLYDYKRRRWVRVWDC